MSVNLKSKPNSKPKPQVKTTLVIDRETWSKVKAEATRLDMNTNDLVVLATELLLELIGAGRIPDDLGYMLERRNPKLLNKLSEIIR